ncbi:MAG: hypothetical protein ACI9HY_001406, partial [Planctomycetaceae bacterium]
RNKLAKMGGKLSLDVSLIHDDWRIPWMRSV